MTTFDPRPAPACRAMCKAGKTGQHTCLWQQPFVKTVCVAGRFVLDSAGQPLLPVRAVFGGQAPGSTENGTGLSFTGEAGRLIDRQIGKYLPDTGIYLTNMARCFPGKKPGAKDDAIPSRAVLDACFPYLDAEMKALKPEVFVAVGNIAIAQAMGVPLNQAKVGRMAGSTHASRWPGTDVFPIHHPAWVLRGGSADVWDAEFRALSDLLNAVKRPEPCKVVILTNVADVETLHRSMEHRWAVAYDLETTSVDPFLPGVKYQYVGYCFDEDTGYAYALDEKTLPYHERFLRTCPEVIVHHSPFDLTFGLAHLGLLPSGRMIDTKALAFLVDNTQPVDLASLCARYVPEMYGLKQPSMKDGSYKPDAAQAARDAVATFRLARRLQEIMVWSPE